MDKLVQWARATSQSNQLEQPATRTNLRDHINHKHREERTFICPICQRAFKSKGKLCQHKFEHSKTEKVFKCHSCDHIARGEKALATHVEKRHGDYKTEKIVCEVCEKTFSCPVSLSNHVKKSHGNAPEFKCEWCNFSTKHKISLGHHKLSHSEIKQNVFNCEVCGFSTHYKNGQLGAPQASNFTTSW